MNRGQLMQRLHAVAANRGFDHAALREQCGVASLRALSDAQLLAHIQRLTARDRRPRLVNTVHGDASLDQRRKLHALFAQLGWNRAKARGWMQARYGVKDLWKDGELESGKASEMISALENALQKGPGGRIAKGCSASPSVPCSPFPVPSTAEHP